VIKAQPAQAMLRPSLRGIPAVSTFRRWSLVTEHGNLSCYSKQEDTMDG